MNFIIYATNSEYGLLHAGHESWIEEAGFKLKVSGACDTSINISSLKELTRFSAAADRANFEIIVGEGHIEILDQKGRDIITPDNWISPSKEER